MNKIRQYLLLLIGCISFVSCSEETASEYERLIYDFNSSIGGEISQSQMWRATVKINVDVKCSESTTVRAYVTKDGTTFLSDQKTVSKSDKISLTVPQGYSSTVTLFAFDSKNTQYGYVKLNGSHEYTALIDMINKSINCKEREEDDFSEDMIMSRGPINPQYNGSSLIGKGHYEEWLPSDWLYVALMARPSINPATIGEIVNYELVSNGPFQITFMCGFKGYTSPHILGYYTHSQGTYDDLKFTDIADTHSYFYLDGQCMVQYQLDNVNEWKDANFNLNYDFNYSYAKEYDIYNTLLIAEKYGTNISRVRGLTFPIDVPAGTRIGFYIREEDSTEPAQLAMLQNLGLPMEKFSKTFKATNFSAQLLNNGQTHRSWIKNCGDYTFMGMEDKIYGGDFDCNDVMFGITTESADIVLPDIIIPEIDSLINVVEPDKPIIPDNPDVPASPLTYSPLPWTIAYEDTHRNPDFDFNDAVIQLMPDYQNEKICVTVLAAGYDCKMYLHYDGPEGDQNLGEIHDILGEEHTSFINTNANVTKAGVEIDCVDWPKEYSVENDARRFYIEIIRGTCKDCSDILSLPSTPGQLPQALLVPGKWKWPREGVAINNSYMNYSAWAKEDKNISNWPWHNLPTVGKCVNR